MVFPTCPEVLAPYHADIFQNGDLKYFLGGPPYLRTLMAHPTPILGGTPGFFHQNDHNGRKRDVLDRGVYSSRKSELFQYFKVAPPTCEL